MKTNIAVLYICVFLAAGCSEDNKSNSSEIGDLSSDECSSIGGRIIKGIGCAKDIPTEEMRKMCKNNGMKYSLDLNGCIE
ncbi:hypothetical protein [Candidatus Vondammii sp. HM_W22]|uniref:hypothetical protein n=1 Tax=Candidatus Vondammii sp. HM_W22 TaxID=2687299 RepID=UPI001F13AD4D|nr:hypothetical protein [Candidatus Vondammii sp. HM_W22]